MKRSEINRALREMEAALNRCQISLPPFCHFTPDSWQDKGHEYDEVRDNMLGWDITDYGQGDFNRVGFSLITLRNGNLKLRDRYAKTYAEKLIYLKEGQYSPNHFHWSKMEDIINRWGGVLLIRVYNSLPDESIDKKSDVTVHLDGCTLAIYNIPELLRHSFISFPADGASINDFGERLKECICGIFDEGIPFAPCMWNRDECKQCKFRLYCRHRQ